MKKFNTIALLVLGMFVVVSVISAASYDTYYLEKVGQFDHGSDVSIKKGRVVNVRWTNGSTNSDAQIAVTLNKKKLFGGYTNITRKQKWIKGIPSDTFYFGDECADGTYRAHIVFNDSNDNKTISGQYQLANS